MTTDLLPLRKKPTSRALPTGVFDELAPRFDFLEKASGYRSAPAFLATEKHLDRTVLLQIFRIKEGATALKTAMAQGEIKLPWSTFIYDVIRLESGHVILVSEPIEAPVLSEWMKTATDSEIEAVREQLEEWVSEWDRTWIQGARLDANSIRVMTTSAGRPFCKVVSVKRVRKRTATVDSMNVIFNRARKAAHHARTRRSDIAWFDSMFGDSVRPGDNSGDSGTNADADSIPRREKRSLAPILGFAAACASLLFVVGSALIAYLG